MKKSLLSPAIILISLVVMASGTNSGIASSLIPWTLPTWRRAVDLPGGGHRTSLGGSVRDKIIKHLPMSILLSESTGLLCQKGSVASGEGVHKDPLQ